jgi:hypothetical protein
MAASGAVIAFGTTLSRAGTVIAEVVSLSGPSVNREMIDVTHLTSDNQAREFIGGVIDSGEITAEINYIPSNTTHIALIGALTSNAETYVLNLNGNTAWTMSMLVQSFTPNMAVEDELTAAVGFKVTGAITFNS